MGQNLTKKEINNTIIISIVIAGVLILCLMGYLVYTFNNVEESNEGTDISSAQEENETYESASSQIGKTVEESENVLSNEVTNNSSNTTSNITSNTNSNSTAITQTENSTNSTVETNSQISEDEESNTIEEEAEVEVDFVTPIEGEILRDFATDTLVYSETLQEWVTHNGIDIKADKTSVVTAAADGTVESIKNDPRYGLTVIIKHDGGYETVYSNLLTAEFVVEGEEISQGQTIGTVGNTATFEICDDYHLHFEIMEDGNYVDPKLFIEF